MCLDTIIDDLDNIFRDRFHINTTPNAQASTTTRTSGSSTRSPSQAARSTTTRTSGSSTRSPSQAARSVPNFQQQPYGLQAQPGPDQSFHHFHKVHRLRSFTRTYEISVGLQQVTTIILHHPRMFVFEPGSLVNLLCSILSLMAMFFLQLRP